MGTRGGKTVQSESVTQVVSPKAIGPKKMQIPSPVESAIQKPSARKETLVRKAETKNTEVKITRVPRPTPRTKPASLAVETTVAQPPQVTQTWIDNRLPVSPTVLLTWEEKQHRVEVAAYLRAERSGFTTDPVANWLAAEKEIEEDLASRNATTN